MKVATKTTDQEEARRIADRLELEAREQRQTAKAGISLNGVNDALQRATQLAVAGRLDAACARELINDLLAAAGQQTLDFMTSRSWCEAWRASKNGSVKERSFAKYEQVSREWLGFLGKRADQPMEILTKADGVAYRDYLVEAGLSVRTINQTIKLLRGIYSDAVEEGLMSRNPFTGVNRLLSKEENSQRQPFTPADIAALLKTAQGDWKGLILLSATTGLRLMDGARLQWRNIDLEGRVIRLKTAKTGASLTLPMHPDFLKWLESQPRGIGMGAVFPSLANKGGSGKSGLSMAFRRLMERAKVDAGVARTPSAKGRGRTTSQKSFHSLRHFAATQLAANGVRAEIARAITGHKDADAHANYVSADTEILRSAVNAIQLIP